MKNINKLTLAALSLFSFSVAHAQSSISEDFKTSAKIENFCSISAQDVNFGVVALPLTAQTANSSMNVLCTNNTSYKIDLAYSGIYGQGANNGGTTYSATINPYGNGSTYNQYDITDSSDKYIGMLICYGPGDTFNGLLSLNNLEIANLYGYPKTGIQADTKNTCSGKVINQTTFTIGPAYAYGIMTGTTKVDNLAYKITIPSDSTKVWNKGNNSYISIGTSSEQIIDINASIVPDKSSSNYLAQDTYLDTVIAIITY